MTFYIKFRNKELVAIFWRNNDQIRSSVKAAGKEEKRKLKGENNKARKWKKKISK